MSMALLLSSSKPQAVPSACAKGTAAAPFQHGQEPVP